MIVDMLGIAAWIILGIVIHSFYVEDRARLEEHRAEVERQRIEAEWAAIEQERIARAGYERSVDDRAAIAWLIHETQREGA